MKMSRSDSLLVAARLAFPRPHPRSGNDKREAAGAKAGAGYSACGNRRQRKHRTRRFLYGTLLGCLSFFFFSFTFCFCVFCFFAFCLSFFPPLSPIALPSFAVCQATDFVIHPAL